MAPRVSVIVPCYNERSSIGALLDAIRGQDFPLADLEVVIADGMSNDGTREAIRDFASWHPEVRLEIVDNPERSIPVALNRARRRAQGEFILRLDAHSVPEPDYIRRCLDALAETGAANVGGVWRILPGAGGWIGRAIAAAGAHPLGAGDARYRTSGRAGPVETVPFGAFPRSWLDRVGGYDEAMGANEDYQLNHRLIESGGTIWFDPRIRSDYQARESLPALARQYARYGFWKARMVLGHPRSLRWRQILPPVFVLSWPLLGALAMVWNPARFVMGVEFGAYLLVLGAGGVIESIRRRDIGLLFGVPAALATMHLAWGGAFWAGLASKRRKPNPDM